MFQKGEVTNPKGRGKGNVDVTKRLNWSRALAEFFVMNPSATARDAARYFNVSTQWVGMVRNSDSFREVLAQLRDRHFDAMSVGLKDRVTALADQALEEMQDRLDREGQTIPLSDLQSVGEMALKSLGFGQKNGEGSGRNGSTQVNVIVNDKDVLAQARQKMAKIREGKEDSETREDAEKNESEYKLIEHQTREAS